jgi:nicotinamidase-related amidase
VHKAHTHIKPTLVVVDIQREYIMQGPFLLDGIAPSLENCRCVLAHARRHSWSILHVRHVAQGPVFAGERAEFIDGFTPSFNEPTFIKNEISPYTNAQFAEVMMASKNTDVFVMGYGSTQCCLATIVGGSALGLRHSLISDASWARALSTDMSEADSHRYATEIVRLHGNITSTRQVLEVC